jgi:hypothetical protein
MGLVQRLRCSARASSTFMLLLARSSSKWTDLITPSLLGCAPMLGAIAGSPRRVSVWSACPRSWSSRMSRRLLPSCAALCAREGSQPLRSRHSGLWRRGVRQARSFCRLEPLHPLQLRCHQRARTATRRYRPSETHQLHSCAVKVAKPLQLPVFHTSTSREGPCARFRTFGGRGSYSRQVNATFSVLELLRIRAVTLRETQTFFR